MWQADFPLALGLELSHGLSPCCRARELPPFYVQAWV
jgi:hypothetical protein